MPAPTRIGPHRRLSRATDPCYASCVYTLRFAMRSATEDPAARADLYGAAVDMAAWAEDHGGLAAILSQHHGSDDGYLPSPIPLAAAMAARTTRLPITVAALLLALYEPVKLAEDLAIVDLISRGRVSYVIGIGYRDEEFAMFGVPRAGRGDLVEERIKLLQRLWSGEAVDVEGRTVRITPEPFTPGGPMLAYGGGTEVAARRRPGSASCSWPSPTTAPSRTPTATREGTLRRGASFRLRASRTPSSSPTIRSAPGPRSVNTSCLTRAAIRGGTPTERARPRFRGRQRSPR